jgi:hypothetical protein
MTTTIATFPEGTTTTDYWFDSNIANGSFPENRDLASFNLENKIENCVGYQLLGVVAPCSYYVIDQTNNQFVVTVDDSGDKVYKVSITPGTYSAVSIVSQLDTDMTRNTTVVSGGGGVDDLTVLYKMAVLVDATTSQLLFYQTVGATSSSPFSISFPADINSVQDILGFPGATPTTVFSSTAGKVYNNSATAINGGSNTNFLYSPYFVQLSGPLYLKLHSDLAASGDRKPVFFAHEKSAEQFDIVIVNANYDGTITSGPSDKVTVTNNNLSVSTATFWFTLGSRKTYANYNINGTVSEKKYLSFNGGSFLVGIRFFQCSNSINKVQSDMASGDKFMETQPVMDGLPRNPHERYVTGGVLQKPQKRSRSGNIAMPKRRPK